MKAGVRGAPALLMEDHREAYFFWKELQLTGGVCVHVDAHLDVCDFKVPGYTGLDQPEVNCGNYLMPAIHEGLVKELIWVVPPHLRGDRDWLEWAQEELQNWVHLSLADLASLEETQNRVEGQLLGRRLVICESDNLPPLPKDEPIFLDIDIDYFVELPDRIWQTPEELSQQLGELQPTVVTVAYSVLGGYTPIPCRYLGEFTVAAFESVAQVEPLRQALERSEQPEGEAWLKAAWLVLSDSDPHSEAWKKAAELDPGYEARAVDMVCGAMMRDDFEGSRAWLGGMTEGAEETNYLAGFLEFKAGDFESAVKYWQPILDQPELDKGTRAHLLELKGRALTRLKRYAESVEVFQEAIRLDRKDCNLWLELARGQFDGGEYEVAARSYRKAQKLGEGQLAGIEAQLALVGVYRKLGQPSLARAQIRKILKADVPPIIKLKAEMMSFKLSLS